MSEDVEKFDPRKEHLKGLFKKLIAEGAVRIPTRFTGEVTSSFDTLADAVDRTLELARKMPGGENTSEEKICESRLKDLVATLRYQEYANFIPTQTGSGGKPFKVLPRKDFYLTDRKRMGTAEGREIPEVYELGSSPAAAWEFMMVHGIKIGDYVQHKDYGTEKSYGDYNYGGVVVAIDAHGFLFLEGSQHRRRAYVYRKL